MGVYSTDDYLKKIEKQVLQLSNIKPHFEIINEVIRRQTIRIFEKGLGGDGSKSPDYSRKPIYISIKTSPRKVPARGKSSNTAKFKNGKVRKSSYFSGGYAEFKKAIGKGGSGHVNLWLTNNFKTAFINSAKNSLNQSTNDKIILKPRVLESTFNPAGKLDFIFTEYIAFFDLSKDERKYIIDKNMELLREALT